MSIQVVEVKNKNQLKAFIDLPWQLYAKDKHWVPPLKLAVKEILNKKHPFYENSEIKLFLAIKQGHYVGRIAAVINDNHNDFHSEKCGFFGFFEAIEDHEVAKALFQKAEAWLKKHNMKEMRGPMNPSTNYECGLLVDGFDDDPQIMMTYNKPYYQNLIANSGFKKAKDLLAYKLPGSVEIPPLLKRVAQRAEKSHRIVCRPINKANWDKEVDLMLSIYNDAWEKNWGFVPMTENEFRHMGSEMKQIAEPNLILIAEVNGDPAGFIVALPDYNQVFKKIPNGKLLPFGIFKLLFGKKAITRTRVITLGVKEKYRALGLASILIEKCRNNIAELGKVNEIEQSWVLEDNEPMNKPLRLLKADPYKRYRIFEKQL